MDAFLSEDTLARTGSGGFVVALSGGLDSCVLLHLLAAQPQARARGLRALHVHHGLQAQADAWSRHCAGLCHALDVPLSIARVEVSHGEGEGLEAAARRARHAAFEAGIADGDVLALAHHLDDQAETFLLRALRGSGPEGLAAMTPWRPFGLGWMWRPLLGLTRAQLEAHARAHGLRWMEDPSNRDTTLDRNFLRHRVLPLLRERWPHAGAALARSAALSGEAHALLAAEDAQALALARTADPAVLSRAALRDLEPARRARALRRWIQELGLPPLPGQGLVHIERDLLFADGDARARFDWRQARVQAWADLLHAGVIRDALPAAFTQAWDGGAPLALPGGGMLIVEGAARFDPPVLVSARQGGERITLPGRSHSHALKHVLQDQCIPPWERERLPLLSTAAGEVLAAGDLVLSATMDTWLRERGARLRWTPSESIPG
ncbi:tRNA lysidine(34) synthetase TilS [Agrilutibacter solisilvae]|uniref:tRNA(Ile)-lysidine synthase n=1 Tax=Agrilutibacter solisilvae TaxID=2763317 RepID=A0A974Y245_9GAMM|nr:tRNA lysidine(34) synthetase TilS [Lysobacter solisilvae]QSX80031.1 tRNA lysidine(34) synthetase TilS [Lysobacter solisilvae]